MNEDYLKKDSDMSEWKKVKLGDLCKRVTSGGTPTSTNTSYYIDGNIPWLNTKEVNFNRIISTEKKITEAGLNNSAAKWIDKDSVIVAMYGATAGKVAITKIPLTTNQACCNLSFNSLLAEYNFIYYYLKNNFKNLASLANGGAQQNLNSNQIKEFEIYLPPLSEQHRIASILGSLDDKIELNNRINKNLEEQASALFRRWFVDFEFPDPDNDGKPYRSSGGKFIDSELGEIPEGWTIGSLDEYIELDPREKIIKSMEYLFFDMKCLSNVDCSISNGIYRNITSGSSFRNFDTLVAKITPCLENGKTGFVMALSKDQIGRGSTEFIVLRSKGIISPYWIYLLSRSNEFRTKAIKSMTGSSGRQRVQYSELRMIQITFYIDLINKFDLLMQSLFLQIKKNNQENNILIAIRDSLLPKLMNNEIEL